MTPQSRKLRIEHDHTQQAMALARECVDKLYEQKWTEAKQVISYLEGRTTDKALIGKTLILFRLALEGANNAKPETREQSDSQNL